MAVGKGSMNRASKAAKSQEAKKIKVDLEEKEIVPEERTIQEEKEMIIQEVPTKKARTKRTTGNIKKTEEKGKSKAGKKEVKTAVIESMDSQVIDIVEKEREKNKDEEVFEQNVSCGIGEEMPVYLL